MDELLARLRDVPGVLGAAVFVNQQCIAHRLDPPHEPVLLEETLLQIGRMGDALESLEGLNGHRSFFLRFQEGQLFVGFAGEAALMVLARSNTQPALLGVGLNVALLKLERLMSDQSSYAAPRPASDSYAVPPSQGEAVFQHASAGSVPFPSHVANLGISEPPPVPAVASVGVSGSTSASIDLMDMSSPSSVEPLGMNAIRHLIRVFGDFDETDPQGTVRSAIAKFGSTPMTFPKSMYNALVQELSSRLPARLRQQFQARVAE